MYTDQRINLIPEISKTMSTLVEYLEQWNEWNQFGLFQAPLRNMQDDR